MSVHQEKDPILHTNTDVLLLLGQAAVAAACLAVVLSQLAGQELILLLSDLS